MKKELENLICDESFQRWLTSNASPLETHKWKLWLNASTHHKSLYNQAKHLWNAGRFQHIFKLDIEKEWQRFSNRIRLADQREKIKPFRPSNLSRLPKHRWSWQYAGAAVTVFIVLGISFVLIRNQIAARRLSANAYQYVSTEYGQRATITLSDGSSIILNANSRLGYPSELNKESIRTVILEGEAYFHVQKDPEDFHKEFVVRTSEGEIKVLGTKFTVYERGQGTRVVLEEGSVEVSVLSESLDNNHQKTRAHLNPGQLIQFNKQSENITPTEVDVASYITWWQKEYVFNNTPLRDIVQRIEETYGVEVVLPNHELLQRTLSGSIENQNLVILTDALAAALKIDVTRCGNSVLFE